MSNICLADKQVVKPATDPNDANTKGYVDPYDIGKSTDPNDVDGKKYVDPYDGELLEGKADATDPYDLDSDIEAKPDKIPEKNQNPVVQFKDDLMAETVDPVDDGDGFFGGANESWIKWKQVNLQSPKPPIIWPDVGLEIGAGYAGAFGGSVVGLFAGFLVGSVYDAVSSCEQCWVDVAVNMSTFGATLGASSGVYMFGNNEKQVGSPYATYAGAVLPVLIGSIAYRGSLQLNRSGFYLATMPLLATAGFNLTRHYRKKGDSTLFDDFFADDMWVSKEADNLLAFNMRWNLD